MVARRILSNLVMIGILASSALGQPAPAHTPSPAPGPATYTWHLEPPTLKQGSVSLLTLTGLAGITVGTVHLDGREFPMELSPKGTLAWAVIGVDLETKATHLPAEVRFVQNNGGMVKISLDLTVEPTTFKVDRLKLPPEMVNPPTESAKRIEEEEKRLEEIYAGSSPRQFTQDYARPLPGEVTSSFGRRRILNGEEKSPHSGTDIRAPVGKVVKAMNGGTVVLDDDLYFSGKTVILDHGHGIFTLYAHLSEVHVKEGEQVERLHTIGKVGMTGRVTGPHLHLGLKVRGARLNPMGLEKLPFGKMFSGKYPAKAKGKPVPESAIAIN